jgi:O-acetyl-ADP-ribose deacetylase (regulator of RNase III)
MPFASMTTTFVKGDVFEDSKEAPSPRAFAFAGDCSGEMNNGIAVAFKKRWPALAEAYREHAANGKMQLGEVFAWRAKDDTGEVAVYALGIQQGSKKPKVSTLVRALDAMVSRAAGDGVTRVALPLVGAGKDGIDRVRVKRVLTEAGEKTPIDLVVFEQFIRHTSPA